ncbi:alpha-12C2-mannosidase [Cystobacter fuscus]|uniref:glycoside hydrolase family 88 protein n=1 Tax=Cystobacter fuscus TaxID=43 RepID=UPI002B298894|nr:alpha-12C2-mannosidase [Cystobacter fuscus]
MVGGIGERAFTLRLVACLCVLAAGPARAFDEATADRALQFAQQQLNRTASNPRLVPTQSPKASTDGTWTLVSNTNKIGWTQGFYPGLLWFMYERTGRDAYWSTKAEAWTLALDNQKSDPDITKLTHDLGFKFMTSYGNAYRLTGSDTLRQTMMTAANSLAQRYNAAAGIIDCCDWSETPPWQVSMVTDTMMNLELLFWAARNGGDSNWSNLALNHALKTLTDMVREDGGTFHVVDYDNSGRLLGKRTYQGYSRDSTWARGQAWAIYGFTMAYRYTGDARMLQAAQRVANYYLDRVPSDFIPNWDFEPAAPRQKDSSAAAIVASALQELSTYVTDPAVAQRYWNAALSTLDTLCSPGYLAEGSPSPGILLHGVGFHPNQQNPRGAEVDKSLIYSDYFFVEALTRFKLASAGGWYSTLDFPRSLHDLGTHNTGVQVVEFDVTPLSKPIDTVIGYADTSTNVTSYASLALAVRLNPSGFFDVRRGGEYAALINLAYEANTTYHVRIRADMNARTYSVWVTPQGGGEVQLADRFAFRSDAPPTNDLGKLSLKSGHFDNEIRVTGHTVRAETAASPAPDSPAEQPEPTGEATLVDDGQSGCAAASGTTMVVAGLLLWLLGVSRRPRAPRRQR